MFSFSARSAFSLLLALLAGTGTSSCTPPRYIDAEDAGAPGGALEDADAGGKRHAGAAELDEIPAWAKPLLGAFALQNVYFAKGAGIARLLDDNVRVRQEEVWLARFEAREGQLILSTTACELSFHVSTTSGVLTGQLLKPEIMGVRHFEVHFGSDRTWYARPLDELHIGYEPTAPGACSYGEQAIAAPPEQTWLTSCKCPSREGVPADNQVTDCRIRDSDEDALPGATIRFTTAGREETDAIAYRDASAYDQGRVDPQGKHTAQNPRSHQYAHLNCSTGPCVPAQDVLDCPASTTSASFVPLHERGEPWTCQELLERREELFSRFKIDFPEDDC